MGRKVKEVNSDLVANAVVAPHRYTWDRDDGVMEKGYRQTIDLAPYKVGDVVLVEVGNTAVKAIVLSVLAYRDRYGDYQEYYRVARETKKGLWAKVWCNTFPGFIQRGYALAGLAPDVKL